MSPTPPILPSVGRHSAATTASGGRGQTGAMGTTEDRLDSLGLTLPTASTPQGNYVQAKRVGDLLEVGGHGPISGDEIVIGKVGVDVTLEEARRAARLTGLQMLATVQAELGSLDRVAQVVKVFGMVNVGDGFDRMPAVIDGCSDLLVEVLEERGRHTRSAVGMASLPFGIAVEIEMRLEVRD